MSNLGHWSEMLVGGLMATLACSGSTTGATGAGTGGQSLVSNPGAGGGASGSGATTSAGAISGAGATSPGGSPGSGGYMQLPAGGSTAKGGSIAAGGALIPGGSGSVGAAGSAQGGSGGNGGLGAAGASPGGAAGSGGGGPIPHGACLDVITDYTKDGPFMVSNKSMPPINYYVPAVPAGCKVPVVHLANGTGATCSVYQPSLQRLASNGFLAACYENTNTGAGDQGLQALDTAIMAFPDLVDKKFGSTGHSQGGQASFTVLALAEKKHPDWIMAGLAMEPASGFGTQPMGATWQQLYAAIKGPMFMFSGLGTDGLVSQAWVQQAYDATSKSEEAYFWTAMGATHIPVPNAQEEEISVPWFRWKLLGDQKACTFFKAIPKTDTVWAEVASKNAQPCQ